jgi:hypothetical protein
MVLQSTISQTKTLKLEVPVLILSQLQKGQGLLPDLLVVQELSVGL